MTLKTILVPLVGTDTDAVALSMAMAVAKRFDAHVDALFVKLDPRDAVPMLGEGMSGAMVDEIMRAAEGEANTHLAAARRSFESAVQAAGLPTRDAPPAVAGGSARWREVVGRVEEEVPREGRLSDLLVFAHTVLDTEGQALATVEAALLASARPLLLAPKAPAGTVGTSVALAWNGNTEAARAVAGAMPFLRKAETVHVLTAQTAVTDAATGRRISEYLSWHGISSRLTIVDSGSEPVGQSLMNKATDLGADLLVMGGYGHSRMREMILGGVTRHVLNHADLPVLMAH